MRLAAQEDDWVDATGAVGGEKGRVRERIGERDVQIINPIEQREVRGDHREGVAQRE